MFYWCWVNVEQGESTSTFQTFLLVTSFLYYLWHFIFWVFSLVVVIAAAGILWGHLAASSETRKAVLKQNLIYVSVLGLETLFIIVFWLTQYILIRHHYQKELRPYFFTKGDVALAIMFAIIHSLRGTVDFFVWVWTFSIGPMDISDLYRRCRIKFSSKKEAQVPLHFPHQLDTPLLVTSKKDTLVNKALRRSAIYCINVGILDSVQLDLDRCRRDCRVGSVRDDFAAAALMDLDHENQIGEVALLYKDPNYREQSVRKIKFPASSSHNIKVFSFIDLEPRVFSMLRQTCGISPRMYRKSFEIKNAADIDGSLMLEKFTEGKSGSFFYFTQDYRFIIKTVSASEEKFLYRIAYDYYQHIRANKDTLIVRFFGLHKVRLAPEQRFITVVVMENIFYNSDMLKIHRRFDLKGSWVGRRSLKGRRSSLDGYKGTLKDLDLGDEKILIGVEQKEQLMDQLRKDVQFLTKCHIMDYSLLLGIHQHGSVRDPSASATNNVESNFIVVDLPTSSDMKDTHQSPDKKSRAFSTRHDTMTSTYGFDRELYIPWFRQDNGGLQSSSDLPVDLEEHPRDSMVNVSNPPVTYFFGVVDILQQYTLRKKVEHLWKTRVLRQDRHGLSAVNENEYGERFLKFLDNIIE